ncbi:MAG: RDD family protein [Alphaproteobacteria bacterium]|nr:RDD family protein [Alphaproteobacteria bacterium]
MGSELAINYASFRKRLFASICDLIILYSLMLTFVSHAFFLFDYSFKVFSWNGNRLSVLTVTLVVVSLLVIPWLYFSIFESSKAQATLGKLLFSICVVDEQKRRISFLRATLRHFGKMISAFFFFTGFILAAFTVKKQGFHDVISRCLVLVK